LQHIWGGSACDDEHQISPVTILQFSTQKRNGVESAAGCLWCTNNETETKSAFCVCRMSYQDFVKNYQKLEICNLGADSLTDAKSAAKRWEMTVRDGCWKKRVNAGGCRNYLGMQHLYRIFVHMFLELL